MDVRDVLLSLCRDALKDEHGELVTNAAEHIRRPPRHSMYSQERLTITRPGSPSRRQIWFDTLRASELVLANLSDHVLAISTLLSTGYPLYAHGSLVRGVYEAYLRLRYLLDDRVSLETRLLRGAAMLLQSAQEDVRAVSEMKLSIQDLRKGRRYLERKLREFERVLDGAGVIRGRDSVSWPDGGHESLKFNATDQAKKFGRFDGLYRLSSGIAHSGVWMLDDLPNTKDGMASLAPSPFSVAGLVDAALGVCADANEAHARYYGSSFDAVKARTASRRKAVVDGMLELPPDRR